MTLAQSHVATSRQLIEHAEEELRNGDLLQASEKAWGATAHQLKAIARQRRWRHGGHYHLGQIVSRLADETGDSDLEVFYTAAEGLHANFYNNWKTENGVHAGIDAVKRLLDKLSAIYENGN